MLMLCTNTEETGGIVAANYDDFAASFLP